MLPERMATFAESSVQLQRFGTLGIDDRVPFETEQTDRARPWRERVQSKLRRCEEVYGAKR